MLASRQAAAIEFTETLQVLHCRGVEDAWDACHSLPNQTGLMHKP